MSTVLFKAWLPDQPDLNNPGLIEAQNALPVGNADSGFEPYNPIAALGAATTMGSTHPLNIISILASSPGGGTPYVYSATLEGKIYQSVASAGIVSTLSSSAISQPAVALVQYNDLVFAAAGRAGLFWQTSGSSSTFNAIVGSPFGTVLGVIGQFLMTGNLQSSPVIAPHVVQWSSIANPTDWPTPGSDSALASQSGEQFLHMQLGGVTGIFGGDQWGVIFQQGGITRVTYIGGNDVFQFDTLAAGIGMDYANGAVKIGNQIYFCSSKGFYATDGTSLLPIGEGKVNEWFITNVVNQSLLVQVQTAVDWPNKLIYWCFPAVNTPIVVYNYETDRFTHAVDANLGGLVSGNVGSFALLGIEGITQTGLLGKFNGTPGTATFITGEAELNPGMYTRVNGIKPLVVGATANAMVSSIGYRSDFTGAATFDTDTTQNARSGFADFRREARYHRARVKVTGAFTVAQGLEFNAVAGGAA